MSHSPDAKHTMTLEQARSIFWLRNNHRPLGELLDEGYLSERRLQWAADKAYNPQLKAAASVLLKHLRAQAAPPAPPATASWADAAVTTVKTGITLQQARATLWPFNNFKNQPMGELVDTRQLRLKDLTYAVENAWDERVRQAAIALLAVRLDQAVEEPAPAAGPLKVISGGKSYSESKELRWTLVEGAFLGGGMVGSILLFIYFLSKMTTEPGGFGHLPETPVEAIAFTIAMILIVIMIWLPKRAFTAAQNKIDSEIETARKGQKGEEQVLEALRQNLDGNWTLFRNVVLPGKNKADIDSVLVGPPGVWALEIKNFSGTYRNFGEHWEYAAGKGRKLLKQSPSRQAQNNAVRLANFFRADGVRQWVDPVVVWANPGSALTIENPAVAVWTLQGLPEELGNIWQGQTVDEQARAKIVEKLTLLCERQREKALAKRNVRLQKAAS